MYIELTQKTLPGTQSPLSTLIVITCSCLVPGDNYSHIVYFERAEAIQVAELVKWELAIWMGEQVVLDSFFLFTIHKRLKGHLWAGSQNNSVQKDC